MSTFLFWPLPTSSILDGWRSGASRQRAAALRAYRAETTVTLPNGSAIRPTLQASRSALEAAAEFGAPLAIEMGGYELLTP